MANGLVEPSRTRENMTSMSVTLEVSQWAMGWLNPEAKWNMPYMSVTLEVSQWPMGWSSPRPKENIPNMSVALEVSTGRQAG